MNRRLIIRPEAEADLTDTAVWYDSREPGLGINQYFLSLCSSRLQQFPLKFLLQCLVLRQLLDLSLNLHGNRLLLCVTAKASAGF
jgi:hypothetical protein